MADRPDKSVSDAVTLDRYTSEIENLLKVNQHYYHENETDSLHTSYGQLCKFFLKDVINKDELNYNRARRLLDEHPLEAFKLKVIQFLRFVEDKVPYCSLQTAMQRLFILMFIMFSFWSGPADPESFSW